MQLQVSTCYAGDRNQWCFRRYFQSTHTTLVGLGALDEKPPLLFSHGLRINIQACKQLEGSYYSSRYNPVCARSLLCQTVSLYAHQPVNILLVLCHHGPWTVCEHFYYKISQLQPFFMRPKKKKKLVWDSEQLQGISVLHTLWCVPYNCWCCTFTCSKLSGLSHIQVVAIMHCLLLCWLQVFGKRSSISKLYQQLAR